MPLGSPNLYNSLCFVVLNMNHRAEIDIAVLSKVLHGTTCSVPSLPNTDSSLHSKI
jgi:hypothetical protein